MALAAATVWEVRTAGSDTNGGGFVAGAAGTDYSQQNAANTVGADISTTDAVAAGTTTITSATANFGTTIVGNIVYFSGGTGSITGVWRQVTARASTTSITIDASIAASTGMTMNIGGALATAVPALASMVASNKIFVKSGAYSTTAGWIAGIGVAPTASAPFCRLIGYTTTRGDSGRPTLTLATNTGLTAIKAVANGGWIIENFVVDCASLGTSIGIGIRESSIVRNCKVSNFTTSGIANTTNPIALVENCEVTGGTSAATAAINITQRSSIIDCYVHDNACPGVALASAALINCLITNNTGASSDGIVMNVGPGASVVVSNVVHGNGRDGLRTGSNGLTASLVRNNIFTQNAGFGLNPVASAGAAADRIFDGNAYYLNTSGARSNCDDTTTNKVNGVAPYTNIFDVTLSASPYVSAGTGDYRLNTTAGGGAACRAVGVPGAFPAGLTTGYQDIGAAQHADPTKMLTVMGMTGGME